MSNSPASPKPKKPEDPDPEYRCTSFDLWVNRVEEFRKGDHFPRELDTYLIPLELDGKAPEEGCRWRKDRKSSEITEEQARMRIMNDEGNIGLVSTCDPDVLDPKAFGFIVIDIDLDDNGNYILPDDKIQELIEELNTFTVKTRSGGYHLYCVAMPHYAKFIRDLTGSYCPHPKWGGKDWGEIRVCWSYVAAVGSYIPPNDPNQKKGCRSDADGYYSVVRDAPFRMLHDMRSLPKWVMSGLTGEGGSTCTSSNGRRTPSSLNLDCKLIDEYNRCEDVNTLVNRHGTTLGEVRRQYKNIDALLTSAEATLPNNPNDRSVADWYVVKALRENHFTPEQIYAIVLRCRPHEKVLREDYLERTIANACC
jgi:hypothetical protein